MKATLEQIQSHIRRLPVGNIDLKRLAPKRVLLLAKGGGLTGLGDQTYTLASLVKPLRQVLPEAEIKFCARYPLIGVPDSLGLRKVQSVGGLGKYDFVLIYSADDAIKEAVLSRANNFIMPLDNSANWSANESWLCRENGKLYLTHSPKNPKVFFDNHPYFFSNIFLQMIGLTPSANKLFLERPAGSLQQFIDQVGYYARKTKPISAAKLTSSILFNVFTAKRRSVDYLDDWTALARVFTARHQKVIVEGGINDDQLKSVTDSNWPASTILPSRWITADELLRLISHIPLLIGIDSAPTHLATGLGIPSITFFDDFSPQVFSYFDRPAFTFQVDGEGGFPLNQMVELSSILLRRAGWLERYGQPDDLITSRSRKAIDLADEAIATLKPSAVNKVRQELLSIIKMVAKKRRTPLISLFQQELVDIKKESCLDLPETALFSIRLTNYYKLIRWLAGFSN